MSLEFPNLFSPFQIKNVALRNRIVMLPHVTYYATEDRTPSARHFHYYTERARGGVGLIITESQYVHESSAIGHCVDASSRDGMLRWRETIAGVHDLGSAMFAQLTHHGIQGDGAHSYLPLLSPSAISDATVNQIPKAMDADDMATVIDAFRAAAANVRAAGFDGVELKIGHDGLLRAFLSPYFNRRADDYGGTPDNRSRFVLEVLRAVRREIGDDYPLGIRYCLDECIPGGYGLDDALHYAELFSASGLIDYFSADMGTWMSVDWQVPPMSVPPGYAVAATARLKATVAQPVIGFGRIKSPAQAERILADGSADLIGLTRALIADPEFARKALEGRTDDIRPCVACNQECVGRLVRALPIGCVHNPAAGHEKSLGVATLQPATHIKKVVVIGGGPFGLKVAEVAAARGHHVTLIEQGAILGGQVAVAARAPGHTEWGEIVTYLAGRLDRLGVTVRLNTTATLDLIQAESPDAVVVATGAAPAAPPFAVKGTLPIWDEWQVMAGDMPHNRRIALLDLGVRYEGAALAETLVERGNQVTWIAPTPTVAFEVDPPSLLPLRRALAAKGTVCMAESIVIEVGDESALLLNPLTGTVQPLAPIDGLVIAGNKRADNALVALLKPHFAEVYTGGDSVAPRHVAIAIREGEHVGRTI